MKLVGGYHFNTGKIAEASSLVLDFHYSKRCPGNVQLVGTLHEDGGLFGGDGRCIAACFFSSPPTRWSDTVLELTRLVRDEELKPPLTALIAATANAARKVGADLLVSFADWGHGHHGGIYQASSWNFAGKRNRAMDGVIYRGKFIPGRTCNALWGTRSPVILAERGIVTEPHFDEGKFLYWRPLSKSGIQKADRLGLESLPYPKPDKSKAFDG